jgi:hypothetical protein
VFKRVALFLLAVSLLPTDIEAAVTFPDTYWPITCFERVGSRTFTSRHRAWITNQRIIHGVARTFR